LFTEHDREVLMPDRVITFSDQEQQQIEAIVIDKDGEEALRYLGSLLATFKSGESHACGPKAAG
jgi:hypothetical protein